MPSIVRFEPLRGFVSLRDAMDRLVEDSFINPRSGFLSPVMGGNMPLDIYETDQEVVVRASMPGVKPEDVDISVVGDTLTVKGEAKSDDEVEEGCYYCRERRHASFQRTVTLPSVTVPDKAEARLDNGILTLTLPKAEAVKPKSIKVSAVE